MFYYLKHYVKMPGEAVLLIQNYEYVYKCSGNRLTY